MQQTFQVEATRRGFSWDLSPPLPGDSQAKRGQVSRGGDMGAFGSIRGTRKKKRPEQWGSVDVALLVFGAGSKPCRLVAFGHLRPVCFWEQKNRRRREFVLAKHPRAFLSLWRFFFVLRLQWNSVYQTKAEETVRLCGRVRCE